MWWETKLCPCLMEFLWIPHFKTRECSTKGSTTIVCCILNTNQNKFYFVAENVPHTFLWLAKGSTKSLC